jgi:hypothetical protein
MSDLLQGAKPFVPTSGGETTVTLEDEKGNRWTVPVRDELGRPIDARAMSGGMRQLGEARGAQARRLHRPVRAARPSWLTLPGQAAGLKCPSGGCH